MVEFYFMWPLQQRWQPDNMPKL